MTASSTPVGAGVATVVMPVDCMVPPALRVTVVTLDNVYGLPPMVTASVAFLPPGAVYESLQGPPSLCWGIGTAAAGLLTLVVAQTSVSRCEANLRAWYDRNSGRKDMD